MKTKELQSLLQHPYSRDNWKTILLNMFPNANMDAVPEEIALDTKKRLVSVQNILKFGSIRLGQDELIFIEVQLNEQAVDVTRNRVGLRDLIKAEINPGLIDGALIVYYGANKEDWRLTFYSEKYELSEDGELVKESTHPKRYTYELGSNESCKTASNQLMKVIDFAEENTLSTVLKSFSVQKVSKEFFDEYKHQYDKFVGYLTGKIWTKKGVKEVGDRISQFQFFFKATSDHEKEARDFVKKLLGRIVFLHFVQKKKWLGASSVNYTDGDTNFIYNLFKEVPEDQKGQFYSQWLTKLFFDTLNTNDNHTFGMPGGSEVYIPFLNGGLFERDETDKNTEQLPLPASLFSNPEDTESPKTRGFLDFLSAYNFTIHEDSPGDHTIAVDPEMLGHIFENLLEDNKDKGAYYTPKPIVHYMCQESLIEYLLTKLTVDNVDEEKKKELRAHLEDFIKRQEASNLVSYTQSLLKALKEVKVCDPAIGSGAFPMGILQEIYQAVETLHHLSPDNVQAIWELPDDDWHPAEVKKQIIQNSIYGVDIEKGAVDIARLRFWLSLIVDEEEPTALPNLDYKIVVGDSLISRLKIDGKEQIVNINWELKGDVGSTKDYLQNLKDTLETIVERQKRYFDAETEEKTKLKNEIDRLKIQALIHQLHFDREYYSSQTEEKGGLLPTAKDLEHNQNRKLTLIGFNDLINELEKRRDNPSSVAYFDWKLDFPEVLNPQIDNEIGFDIVIGNPPYVSYYGNTGATLSDEDRKYFQKNYDSVLRENERINSMNIFSEKGLKLLNNDGYITFIVNKTMAVLPSYNNVRNYFLNKARFTFTMIDLTPFEAIVDCFIYGAKNNDDSSDRKLKYYEGDIENFKVIDQSAFTNNPKSEFIKSEFESILSKVEEFTSNLKDLITINRGVNIGGCFDDFLSPVKENDDYKKYLAGTKNIKPYFWKWDVDDGYMNFDTDKEDRLRNQGKTLVLGKKERFLSEKIFIPESGQSIMAAYCEEELYSAYGLLVGTSENNELLKSALALLNSRLFTFYCIEREILRKGNKATPHVGVRGLNAVPVPFDVSDNEIQERLSSIVEQILTKKEANPEADTTALEQQIDTLVYKLYNLTWEEVQVIDPEFGMSEEEYEVFNINEE